MFWKFIAWYLRSVTKLTLWFAKKVGPAMLVALVPTFLIGGVTVVLFGSSSEPSSTGLLFTAPALTTDVIGVTFLGATILAYVFGWQILVEAPRAALEAARSSIGALSAYYRS